MFVNLGFKPSAIAVGEQLCEQLDMGRDCVVVKNTGFHSNGKEAYQFAREATSMLGQLTLSGSGSTQTDVWELNETRSSPRRVDYHTDNPHYEKPEAYVGFWCVSSAHDGANLLLNSEDFLHVLNKRDKNLADLVQQEPVNFVYEGTKHTAPVFSPTDGQLRLGRYTCRDQDNELIRLISLAIDNDGIKPTHRVHLLPGDVMFFNNHRLLHAREPYCQKPGATPRLILRTRVN